MNHFKEQFLNKLVEKEDIKNINLYISNIEENIIKIKNEGKSIIDDVFLAFNGSINHISLYAYLFDHDVQVDLDCLNYIYENSYIEEEKVISEKIISEKEKEKIVDVAKFDSEMIYYIVSSYKKNFETNYILTIKDIENFILEYKNKVYEASIEVYKQKYNDGIKVYNIFLDMYYFYYDEKKMKFIKKDKVHNTIENYNEYIDANVDVEFYELKYHLIVKKTKSHPAIIFFSDAINELHLKDKTIIVSVDAIKLTNTEHQHIIGILGLNTDGEMVIQGIRNQIKLHINQNCVINYGIYCIGHIILLQGQMKLSNKTLYVSEIMHPPRNFEDEITVEDMFYEFENENEKKDIREYELIVKNYKNELNWIIMHDVFLDNPLTFNILDKMFSLYVNTYKENDFPIGFIFMGNFISLKLDYTVNFNNAYINGFEKLATLLITKFKLIVKNCYLIFIPGINDPVACKNSIPKSPILPYFIKKFKETINSTFNLSDKKIIFATNPCRIRHLNKRMIFFRHNIMNDLVWSSLINGNDKNNENILISTIIGQSHIYPIPNDNRILKKYSSFLFLYPLPNFICICDNTCNSFISYVSENKEDAIISNCDMSFTKKKVFTVYNILNHEAKRFVVPI